MHRQYPFSRPELSETARCIWESLCESNNKNDLPGFTKSDVDTMIHTLVNQTDNSFLLILLYSIVPTLLRVNK